MNTQAQASKLFPGGGPAFQEIEDKELSEQVNKAGDTVFEELKGILPLINKPGRRLVSMTVVDLDAIQGKVLAVTYNGGQFPLADIARINLANFKGVSDGATIDEETGTPITQTSLGSIVVCSLDKD